jgi:hypothetical protein
MLPDMVDDRGFVALGYLRVESRGGVRATEIRDLLDALEGAYQAVARVEVAAERLLEAFEWMGRYGPPVRYWGGFPEAPVLGSLDTADPLIVSRVELSSPGFWELLGSRTPLEVLRKYLNDRHERGKDRDYRSDAERQRLELENERLAIDNAMSAINVVDRLYRLERQHGRDFYESQAWRRTMGAELRKPLEQLGDFDTRGLIDGGSAQSGPERLDPPSDASQT